MFLRLPWLVSVITPIVPRFFPGIEFIIPGAVSLFQGWFGGRQRSQAHRRQLTSEDARHAASLADRAEARRMAREDWRYAMDQWLEERKARREAATGVLGPLLAQTPLAGVDPAALVAAGGSGMPAQLMMPPGVDAGGAPIPVSSAGPPPGGGGQQNFMNNPFMQALIFDQMGRGGGATPTPTGGNIMSDWKM